MSLRSLTFFLMAAVFSNGAIKKRFKCVSCGAQFHAPSAAAEAALQAQFSASGSASGAAAATPAAPAAAPADAPPFPAEGMLQCGACGRMYPQLGARCYCDCGGALHARSQLEHFSAAQQPQHSPAQHFSNAPQQPSSAPGVAIHADIPQPAPAAPGVVHAPTPPPSLPQPQSQPQPQSAGAAAASPPQPAGAAAASPPQPAGAAAASPPQPAGAAAASPPQDVAAARRLWQEHASAGAPPPLGAQVPLWPPAQRRVCIELRGAGHEAVSSARAPVGCPGVVMRAALRGARAVGPATSRRRRCRIPGQRQGGAATFRRYSAGTLPLQSSCAAKSRHLPAPAPAQGGGTEGRIVKGMEVRVRDGVQPANGWRKVEPGDVGVVTFVAGHECLVDFPKKAGWSHTPSRGGIVGWYGLVKDMEPAKAGHAAGWQAEIEPGRLGLSRAGWI
eukprot:gene12633-biopygen12904